MKLSRSLLINLSKNSKFSGYVKAFGHVSREEALDAVRQTDFNVLLRPQLRYANDGFPKLRWLLDETEKRPEDDQSVLIEDDVWVGTDAIILKGVTIGRDSTDAANSVVTRSVLRYSIVAGNPARLIKMRFTPEQVMVHEDLLRGAH